MTDASKPPHPAAPAENASNPSNETPFRYTAALAGAMERKWQARWEREQTFRMPNPGEPGFDASRPRFYCLDMFPYPSGAGLHVGHPEGYTATDIVARYHLMRGENVLHPMGWDAFGLPAEQYAIQTGVHPATTTRKAIENFRRQLQRFGFMYDWSREIATIDEDYYRFTQWIFLRIYDAFFDVAVKKARPIAELVAEFEKGTRPVRINPDAAEYSAEQKAKELGKWAELDEAARHRVIASYRLAYISDQTVNWCPKLGTALANEEVIDGKSERGGFPVLRKPLKQWLFRITAYADRLLDGLAGIEWPESTKTRQTDWIGRSEGADIDFPLATKVPGHDHIRVYTTCPDTIFGATYMVVAPEHPLVEAALSAGGATAGEHAAALRSYVNEAKNRSDVTRQKSKEKTGVFTGVMAKNPATGEEIPVWTADYVLMGYGHGAIMAVPAHDERDHEFATVFSLPIRDVIRTTDGSMFEGCFTGPGVAIASSNAEVSLDGLPTKDAKKRIVDWIEQKKLGHRRVNYRLRDWLFSRQRYWGEPFPVVYDEHGRHHRVSDAALPVKLPPLADFQPVESNDPQPLLAKATDWLHTTAGEAGVDGLPRSAKVIRETNTMPNWAGSCWYHLRYTDPRNPDRLCSKEAEHYWLGERGVDLYIGGSEHAVLHLLYSRFWHKVLKDLGHVESEEPYRRLFHQGLILSFAYQRADKSLVPNDQVDEPKEGTFVERATGQPVTQIVAKMSKALKNVVNPDDVLDEWGADTFRLYEMYLGPLEATKPWNPRDISGMARFLTRAWRLLVDEETGALKLRDAPDPEIEKMLHRATAKVGADIDRLAFNTAIATLIEVVNAATSKGGFERKQGERFVLLLAPFVPHMAEELWEKLGHTTVLAREPFPAFEEALLRDDLIEVPVQIKGKLRGRIQVPADATDKQTEEIALADPKIQEALAGATVKKVIVVKGRMVNLVT